MQHLNAANVPPPVHMTTIEALDYALALVRNQNARAAYNSHQRRQTDAAMVALEELRKSLVAGTEAPSSVQ
jgi:hypothetical protein